VESLRTQTPFLRKFDFNSPHRDQELILLTLLHAGLPQSDPDVQAILKDVLSARLESTYPVSLKAMCLREMDRTRFQTQIAECKRATRPLIPSEDRVIRVRDDDK
jgi:hypothetical protein